MQTLNINSNNTVETQPYFIERQIYMEATEGQIIFDWLFGIGVPLFCILLDLLVIEGSLFGVINPFVFVLNFALIVTTLAFLIWGKKLRWLNGFFVGVFFVGGAISAAIGIILLPFSIIGLLFVIGILGFTPLCIAFSYLRNAVRAYEFARAGADKKVLLQAAVISALFTFAFPLFLNIHIENKKEEMLNGNVQTIRENADYLYFFSPITSFEMLNIRSEIEMNRERKKALTDAYEKLTGATIEREQTNGF